MSSSQAERTEATLEKGKTQKLIMEGWGETQGCFFRNASATGRKGEGGGTEAE